MIDSNIWKAEKQRISGYLYPEYFIRFIKYLRKAQLCKTRIAKYFYRRKFYKLCYSHGNEIHTYTKIGIGFCLWHPYNITIAPTTIIGNNVTINKGALIGAEFRGKRVGTPVIGDCVWIGANAVIVGNVRIGNNVLIAPNAFVNCDIPDNSVVFGNPCVFKFNINATAGYIQNPIDINNIV